MLYDNGYPHDGHADKYPYPHDRRANKDSLISYYSLIFAWFCNNYVLILLFLFVHRLYVEDPQMIQLLLYANLSIAVGNFTFSSFNW